MKLVCLFKAACKAIEQAKAQDITKLVLYTDSMSMASHLGEGLEAEWLEDQHREEVTNKEDFAELERLARGMDIQWVSAGPRALTTRPRGPGHQ